MEYNQNGGLTLIPLPHFGASAEKLKEIIEGKRDAKKSEIFTPVDIAVPEFGTRASGEPYIRLGKDHIGGHDCMILTSGPGTYEMLIQLLFAIGYVAGRHASRITVVSAYFPLSRSDKDEGSLEFALPRLMVDLMQTAAYGLLQRIIAVDLHSPQSVVAGRPGLITEVSLARRIMKKVIADANDYSPTTKICLLFPDEGAAKRYAYPLQQVTEELGLTLPVALGQKRRLSSRESILTGLSGDTVALNGALVIGFDDEIATGKTNNDIAVFVKEKYAVKRYWSVTIHGVLCDNAPELLQSEKCALDRIYVSDTVKIFERKELASLLANNKLIIVPWESDLATILYFTHWNTTIREMR